MSSAAPNLMQYAWLLFSMLLGTLEIVAAILLLRDRNAGPWLMLIGGIISLVAHTGTQILVISMNAGRLSHSEFGPIMGAVSSVGVVGSLLFFGGLLFYAITRRALHQRVAELESILQSRPPQ